MSTSEDAARECADFIGREVARLGQWKGLGSALARVNVEKHIAALITERERAAYLAGFAEAREAAARACDGAHEQVPKHWEGPYASGLQSAYEAAGDFIRALQPPQGRTP